MDRPGYCNVAMAARGDGWWFAPRGLDSATRGGSSTPASGNFASLDFALIVGPFS